MDPKDDQVLTQLYKKGANEAPSPELDQKILNYAANKNKPKGSSHFGGGWKVPLSLAASVVLVFAILVQLDKSPEQLELPPIPSYDKSDSISTPMDEIGVDDANRSLNEELESDSDMGFEAKKSLGGIESQSPSATERKLKTQESILKKSRQFDDSRLNNELEMNREPPASPPNTESKASMPKSETTKANKTLERIQDPSIDVLGKQKQSAIQEGSRSTNGDAAGTILREKSMDLESNQPQQAQEPMMQHREDAQIAEDESGFAPIPVEDWLLMIEKLIARKDYAEAARQLEKFKQAYPKVNVEDLEAKIP